MIKLKLLVMLLSVISFALAGCGSSSSSDTPPPSANSNGNDNGNGDENGNGNGDTNGNGNGDENGNGNGNGNGDENGNGNGDDEPAGPESWTFYADGLGTLTLTLDGEDVSSVLTPGLFPDDGSVISDAEGTGSEGQTVWAVQLNNTEAGNVFLGVEGTPFSRGLMMTSAMQAEGEVQFDLYVDAIDSETRLIVKLDSGWPNVSEYELDTPETGEWVSMSLPVADFVDNTIEPGAADLERIINAFVLEAAGGTAIVHLNNIQYFCEAENCALEAVQPPEAVEAETLDIYMGDGLHEHYSYLGVFAWDDGALDINEIFDAELETNVFEVTYLNEGAGFYINHPNEIALDLSSFAEGDLVFNLKVDNAADLQSGFIVVADPGAEDQIVDMPEDNEWKTIRIPLSDFTDNGLDITGVTAPFVFLAAAGEQAGVVFRIGNIRWEAPTEEE